ncbi:MAG TPA: CBS domain-containing protein [Pseudonocardiaceae bacterium]|nr:CBS domain-containing protein [Pseudonocardiaceae bacterium]
MLSEVDVLGGRFTPDRRCLQLPATVREVMSHQVITADVATELSDLVDHMWRHRHRCMPVVFQGRLVGVVTRTDLVRTMVSQGVFAS